MNTINIGHKLANAFNATKSGVEGFCDMAKEISGPIALMLWLALCGVAMLWCAVIAKTLGAY